MRGRFQKGLVVSLVAVALAHLANASDTRVTLRVCHTASADKVFAAVAYRDAALGTWVARGWFPQRRGDCRDVMANLPEPIFVFAETKDGSRRFGVKDAAATREFCLDENRGFVTDQRHCSAGSAWRSFAVLTESVQPGATQTWHISDGD